MKKNAIPVLAILGLAAMLAAKPASAQSGVVMTAEIPFEFTVGKTKLPAGKYAVTMRSPSSGVLLIQDDGWHRSVMTLTDKAYASDTMNESLLVFHRYGDQYFLSRVWTSGSDIGCELHKSAAEREISRAYHLAKTDAQVQTVTIAADRH